MGKQETPNWDNAPQWAQYWAVDPDGMAHWFSGEPFSTFDLMGNETFVAGWFTGGAKDDSEQCGYYTNIPDWTKTLQQRPTNALPANGPKEPEFFKVTKGRNYLTGWPDNGF